MGKTLKYETPSEPDGDYTWKTAILIPSLIGGLFLAIYLLAKWMDPSQDRERAHLYRVAFSHPEIKAITGGTSNVSFAPIPKKERPFFARTLPEDWNRKGAADLIEGTARMLIFGEKGGGVFTLSYRYVPSSDHFLIIQIYDGEKPLVEDGPSSQYSATRAAVRLR